MKRSAHVSLSLVTTLAGAALAAGCGSQEGWQTCVDRSSNVSVDQKYCEDEARRTSPGGYGYYPRYHWYYYPHGYYRYAPPIGTPVPTGGTFSTTRFSSVPMAHGSSAVRGGFGSSAIGHSSGS